MPDDTKGKKEIETKDVEMKDAEKKDKDGKGDADAKKEKEEPPKSPRTGCNLQLTFLEFSFQRLPQFRTLQKCDAMGYICFTMFHLLSAATTSPPW